jgi:predicted esterase YcpF (UPF0227 family)
MKTPTVPPNCLLYLHGFRSSPRSAKARWLQAWLQEHHPSVQWCCPTLPPSPREALALAEAHLQEGASSFSGGPFATKPRWAVVGSSLGGFYATVLAQRHGWPTVLVNPAVDPARDLAAYIGLNHAWHSKDRFWFEPRFVDELRAMTPGDLRPQASLYGILSTHDEVLSFQEMRERYRAFPGEVVPGADHGLSEHADPLRKAMAWLGLHEQRGLARD